METSKAYFEDVLRRFGAERRVCILFQFCRDQGVDYNRLPAYKAGDSHPRAARQGPMQLQSGLHLLFQGLQNQLYPHYLYEIQDENNPGVNNISWIVDSTRMGAIWALSGDS